jgi:hypothetical protein
MPFYPATLELCGGQTSSKPVQAGQNGMGATEFLRDRPLGLEEKALESVRKL